MKFYKKLREKFKPWVCLRELDLAATVSLRGYDVIRRIEFHEEENKKYKRGLFQSRFQITRLARDLELHAKTILPFELTTNSVKFNIPEGDSFWPRRGQKLTSLRKLSTIKWSCCDEKKRRTVNTRSATLMPITIPMNSVAPSTNRTNVLVVTWMLQSGRKIDNNGGAAAAKPMGRGASIVFRISEAEKNDFCSPAVLSN